jgi:two-component system, LytTR family, response regulator
MKKIRLLIADDEPLSRAGLAMLAERDDEVELVASCADGQSALEAIRAQRPDLALLDVQMPRLNGVEVVRALGPEERPMVIFVTAHREFAVQAFEMSAVDYLLKPFGDERFRSALGRAKERIRRPDLGELSRRTEQLSDRLSRIEERERSEPGAAGATAPERVAFKVGGEYLLLAPGDVAWIEARGDSIRLGGAGGTHTVRETLQSVERRLDPDRFVRVHRSFLVNVGCVRRIAPTVYGDHDLLMSDGTRIRLSRSHRDKLRSLLRPREA